MANEIIVRTATLDDLDILLQFEQNIISVERPFDRTLKSGHIHYYDIAEMIKASHVEVVVATLNNEIIGSAMHVLKTLSHTSHTRNMLIWVLCMLSRLTEEKVLTKKLLKH